MTLYDVIYADPPWRYNFSRSKSRAVENHYPTMLLDDIKAFPVPAADDAVLFLWATAPKLIEALEVMKAWRFTYCHDILWVKLTKAGTPHIGMGYYVRNCHELLLVGTRGKPNVDLSLTQGTIGARRTRHSAKPVEGYELIEDACPGTRKIELFARNLREGWASWGNEVPAA